MSKPLTLVILGAGMGTRLGELTKEKPKPLMDIAGAPIIQYDLAWAQEALKAEKVIVVGGYLIEKLEAVVRGVAPNALVVENKNFATTQRMSSLLCAKEHIEGDLLMFDGDYIYSTPVAEAVRNHTYQNLAVHSSIKRSPYTEQDVICTIDENRHLIDIYKTAGTVPLEGPEQEWFNSLLYCPEEKLATFFETGERLIKESTTGMVHVEDAVLTYTKENIVDVIDLGEPLWMEVDNPSELKNAAEFVGAYSSIIPR